MSPRIRCSKHTRNRPAVTAGDGQIHLIGTVFTENMGGTTGPVDNAVGIHIDPNGQMCFKVGRVSIPIDHADLRRIGNLCSTAAT
ncbi:hypothetical protein [Corynebacterium sp.]|uniref:hypothetical protein n=1 Tax=Corynebacterium sp. TaxID=1720 RepID=UPI0028ADB608|nr:hypothetical protein [Corynebacterium sp.]